MYKARTYVLLMSFLIAGLIINPLKTSAQPVDPGCDPLDPACPIDGGLSLLIAAGVGIGAKRAYDLRKKQEADTRSGQ